MNKYCVVDFTICDPTRHDPETGICIAMAACTRNILEQEDPFDAPFLISNAMCTGCGKCVSACPIDALSVNNG